MINCCVIYTESIFLHSIKTRKGTKIILKYKIFLQKSCIFNYIPLFLLQIRSVLSRNSMVIVWCEKVISRTQTIANYRTREPIIL